MQSPDHIQKKTIGILTEVIQQLVEEGVDKEVATKRVGENFARLNYSGVNITIELLKAP
ncbi:hypothetical protein [Vibrio scophthalmi]|uniref:Uncharacterized protein n=1 Tax=Vibrio scophthalmi LMG 19158 TaxID=870967 RepID=F9RIA7_9VIBR|nr:hypothetical protein [Vibrio scophthalmi]EGU42439.1 hypothetical protein VIS19158_11598 [Vibrio scophthalmi LMG 19158]